MGSIQDELRKVDPHAGMQRSETIENFNLLDWKQGARGTITRARMDGHTLSVVITIDGKAYISSVFRKTQALYQAVQSFIVRHKVKQEKELIGATVVITPASSLQKIPGIRIEK